LIPSDYALLLAKVQKFFEIIYNQPPFYALFNNRGHGSFVMYKTGCLFQYELARWQREVIFEARKLRLRGIGNTARKNRSKDAIKREQSHACMSYAEREHPR
jgi:hypothetical protein